MIFAGGTVGTALRVSLLEVFGNQTAALAGINLTGALLLGFISGLYGSRVSLLRLFLAVGGLASLTSWSTLALQSLHPMGVVIAAIETVLGVAAAGVGHLAGRRRKRRA